jgi:hypothetical protein
MKISAKHLEECHVHPGANHSEAPDFVGRVCVFANDLLCRSCADGANLGNNRFGNDRWRGESPMQLLELDISDGWYSAKEWLLPAMRPLKMICC